MTAAPTGTTPMTAFSANVICMLSMLVWAAALPAADLLIGPVPPLPLTAARMTLAAAVLLPVWLALEGPRAMADAGWWRGILIGGGTIGLGATMLVMGQARTSAVTVAVISATMPVIGIAIEVALDGRRLTAGLILGVLLSLLGGVLAVGDGGGATGAALGIGALLCFGSVVTFTFGSRWTVTAFPSLSPLGRTTVTLTGAAVATCLAALILHLAGGPAPDWAALGWREAGALAVFAIGGLAISQVLWIISVGRLGIALSALHINMTPFYVMLILFALGGRWDWMQALGAAVVLAGVLVAQGLVSLPRRKEV